MQNAGAELKMQSGHGPNTNTQYKHPAVLNTPGGVSKIAQGLKWMRGDMEGKNELCDQWETHFDSTGNPGAHCKYMSLDASWPITRDTINALALHSCNNAVTPSLSAVVYVM